MIYLFIGEDQPAKQEKIQSLKRQLFDPQLESFNYDSFYAKELTLSLFKELLNRFPAGGARERLLVIQDAIRLKDEVLEYLLSQARGLPKELTLILDIVKMPQEDKASWNGLLKAAKAVHFKSRPVLNAFNLGRAVESKQSQPALNLLSDLFRTGEKAERILGALRYQLVKNSANLRLRKRNIALLLEADVNLKTGRLKPEFALETLVIKLCL